MRTTTKIITAIALAALTVTGCTPDTEVPTHDAVASAPAASEPTPAPPSTPGSGMSLADYDDARFLLDLTWEQETYQGREDICRAYTILGEQWTIDQFQGTAAGHINEQALIDHFDEECAR